MVRGRARDVIVVTTSYGKTIAIDPGTGRRLWEFTPRGYASLAGTPQITTATPVFDPDRRYVYAVGPDGLIHKLAVSGGDRGPLGALAGAGDVLPRRTRSSRSPLTISGSPIVVDRRLRSATSCRTRDTSR